MKRLNILILTATVTPRSGIPNFLRADSKVRVTDYAQGLKFYLSLMNQSVDYCIFAENSNADISTLKDLVSQKEAADRFEFLSFDGLDYPPHYNRAYGEFKLIDYVMSHSAVINAQRAARSDVAFWKVTGRYIISNLDRILVKAPKAFELYCNFKNYRRKLTETHFCGVKFGGFERRKMADMFLFAWSWSGYESCVRGMYPKLKTNPEDIKRGIHAEELWRRILDAAPAQIRIVKRLNTTPQIEGVRAGDNKAYQIDGRWKFKIRTIARALIPWVWI